MNCLSANESDLSSKLYRLTGDLNYEMTLLPTWRTVERWSRREVFTAIIRCRKHSSAPYGSADWITSTLSRPIGSKRSSNFAKSTRACSPSSRSNSWITRRDGLGRCRRVRRVPLMRCWLAPTRPPGCVSSQPAAVVRTSSTEWSCRTPRRPDRDAASVRSLDPVLPLRQVVDG